MRSILVIHSNTDSLITVSSMLRGRGYCVIPKTDGGSALAVIHEGPDIDLIIADYKLTDMDALTFMSSLKRISPVRPPVIFLSDRVDIQDYLTAFSFGAFEFLFQPVDQTEFLRIVRVATEREAKENTPAAGRGDRKRRGTSGGGPLSKSYLKSDAMTSLCEPLIE